MDPHVFVLQDLSKYHQRVEVKRARRVNEVSSLLLTEHTVKTVRLAHSLPRERNHELPAGEAPNRNMAAYLCVSAVLQHFPRREPVASVVRPVRLQTRPVQIAFVHRLRTTALCTTATHCSVFSRI